MEIDRKVLLRDLKTIRDYFSYNPKKDIIKADYSKFYHLNSAYNALTGKGLDDEQIFSNPTFYSNMLYKELLRSNYNFCTFLDEHLENFDKMFQQYELMLDKVEFQDAFFPSCSRGYSYKDYMDILFSFYSTIGEKEYKIVKKYIDEKRIQMGMKYSGFNGQYVGLKYLNSGYIFLGDSEYNTNTLNVLVHELGHAIDREIALFPNGNDVNINEDTFSETPSGLMELLFLDYLNKQKIDVDGSNILLNNIFLLICDASYAVYSVITDDKESEFNELDLAGNYVTNDGRKINLRDDLLYGIGYYTALHMLALCDGDFNNIRKEFYDLLMTRNKTKFKDSIEKLGISFDDYLSTKMIYPIVENNTNAIRRRFNFK